MIARAGTDCPVSGEIAASVCIRCSGGFAGDAEETVELRQNSCASFGRCLLLDRSVAANFEVFSDNIYRNIYVVVAEVVQQRRNIFFKFADQRSFHFPLGSHAKNVKPAAPQSAHFRQDFKQGDDPGAKFPFSGSATSVNAGRNYRRCEIKVHLRLTTEIGFDLFEESSVRV